MQAESNAKRCSRECDKLDYPNVKGLEDDDEDDIEMKIFNPTIIQGEGGSSYQDNHSGHPGANDKSTPNLLNGLKSVLKESHNNSNQSSNNQSKDGQ